MIRCRPYYYNPKIDKSVGRFEDIPVAEAEAKIALSLEAEAANAGTGKQLSLDQIDAALAFAAAAAAGTSSKGKSKALAKGKHAASNPRKRPLHPPRAVIDRYQLAPPLYKVEYTASGLPIKRRMLGQDRRGTGGGGGSGHGGSKGAPNVFGAVQQADPAATALQAKNLAWHKARVRLIMQKQNQKRGERDHINASNVDSDASNEAGDQDQEQPLHQTTAAAGVSTAPRMMSKKEHWATARAEYTAPDLYHVGNNKAAGQKEQVEIRKQMTLCCLQKQGSLHVQPASVGTGENTDVEIPDCKLLTCSTCTHSFHCICAGIENDCVDHLGTSWECAICFADRTFLCL